MAVTRGGEVEAVTSGPPPSPGIEVPFLVNNNTKWMSGIVEATTCGDIIKALLAAEGRLKGVHDEQLERFVLVERWRRVERPLKKDSCLLKIWQAWGPEARDVQFILKRVSCKKVSRPRTKVKRTNSKLIKQLAELEQKHPKYAASDSDSEVAHMQGNIQALLKIIIQQRETIQTQLGNLKAKDLYLKTLDKSLSCSDGREYVLRNYLEQIPEHAEETLEESQDSGCGSGNDTQDSCNEAHSPDHTGAGLVVTETSPEAEAEEEAGKVDIMANLFEKLFNLNKKLEEQEDDIFRLTVQMEAMCHTKSTKPPSEAGAEAEGVIHTELKIAQEELDTMAKLNSRLGYEIKRNELALSNMMKNYDGRQQFARRLEVDVSKVEAASQATPAMTPGTTRPAKQALNKIEEETDWECGSNDEDSDDEEIRAGTVYMEQAAAAVAGGASRGKEVFPLLAPPEQFQNCLSPSATYETESCPRLSVASPAYSNDSSVMTSSTATEKSVRFSDRDYILSTPEPGMSSSHLWPLRAHCSDLVPASPGAGGRPDLHPFKVKSILKSDQQSGRQAAAAVPDVTSFFLDKDEGTLV